MATVVPAQTQFNAGELDPKVGGRHDLQWYGNGCVILENMIPTPQGPAVTRPGTIHHATPRDPGGGTDGFVKLLPFIFSDSVAYTVEATDRKFRFHTVNPRAVVESAPGVPFELATPYLVADLPLLRKVQSADVVYLLHKSYKTRKLRRLTATTFDLVDVDFADGPWLATNTDAGDTFTPAANTGLGIAFNFTKSKGFTAGDVGRLIRAFNSGSNWGYGKIATIIDDKSGTIDIVKDFNGATTQWRLGVFSDRTGHPVCGTFHEERFSLGSNPLGSFPRVDCTVTGDFENFKPGTNPDDPLDFVIAGDDVPLIRDLLSDRALIALTSSTEFKLGSETSTDPLSTENPPKIVEISREGAAEATLAIKAKRGILFQQLHQKAILEIAYTVDADSLVTREISIRSAHIGERERYAGSAWANRPWNLLWLWGANGGLSSMAYAPEQEVIAMSRHVLGGAWRAASARPRPPVVESACVVPGAEGDELWLAVKRTIDGATSREICVMAYELRDGQPPDEAVYLDSAVTVRGEAPAADLTFTVLDADLGTYTVAASAGVFTSDAFIGKRIIASLQDGVDKHGLPNWRQVAVDIIARAAANSITVELVSVFLPSDLKLYSGEWRIGITEITGADHLEGETVEILADGAPIESQVVTGGTLELATPAATVTYGLAYKSILQPTRPDAGARMGSSGTRPRRTVSVGLRLLRSGPFSVGTPTGVLEFPLRTPDMPTDEPVPLLTGDAAPIPTGATTERDGFWRLERTGPLPVTVCAAYPIEEVSEGVP